MTEKPECPICLEGYDRTEPLGFFEERDVKGVEKVCFRKRCEVPGALWIYYHE